MKTRYTRQFIEKDYYKKTPSEMSDDEFAFIKDGQRLFPMQDREQAQDSLKKLMLNLTPAEFKRAYDKIQRKFPGLPIEDQ